MPTPQDLARSVARILEAAPGTEAVLANLNYLKLANELRIAVGQLQGSLDGEQARVALSELAGALLGGVLDIAGREIAARHGGFPAAAGDGRSTRGGHQGLAIIGYGSLGACELGYSSDLDLVFLFESGVEASDGSRPLPPERA